LIEHVAEKTRALITQEDGMRDQEIRAALDRHWAASDVGDFKTEHSIYQEDAVLQYPRSGERISGRSNIKITRTKQPSRKRFVVRRIVGRGDLWVTEYILTYDGKPSYTVSIMEFRARKLRGKRSISRIHSRRPRGALGGLRDGHLVTNDISDRSENDSQMSR
jgi:hypothetical protein